MGEWNISEFTHRWSIQFSLSQMGNVCVAITNFWNGGGEYIERVETWK